MLHKETFYWNKKPDRNEYFFNLHTYLYIYIYIVCRNHKVIWIVIYIINNKKNPTP